MGILADRRGVRRRAVFYEALRGGLIAHAERTFALSAVEKDGVSYRETLEGLIERTKRPEKRAEYQAELACPPLPKALRYLWEAFWRLRRRKGGTGFGPAPLEWPDIDAFLRRSRLDLAPFEIEIIEDLDDLYMAQRAKSIAAHGSRDKD